MSMSDDREWETRIPIKRFGVELEQGSAVAADPEVAVKSELSHQ